MTTKVVLPKSGMGIEEGTLIRWFKAEGSPVEKGEIIAEVETAKATQEIESPVNGTLTRILVAEGETTAVNAKLAEIEEA